MPTASQAWMIQRVKWENFVSKTHQEDNSITGLTPIDVEIMNVNGWVCSQRGLQVDNHQPLWSHPDVGRLLKEQGSHHIIQIGCVSLGTMNARAFLRCYDSEGKLNVIVYQEGHLIPPKLKDEVANVIV